MNNQLIEKVIKSNDSNASPEFTYENPLLDINIAGALARSFVKIIRASQQDSNVNNNLRHSVLANIRKLCRVEPENHLEVDEKFTNSLTEVYIKQIEDARMNTSINSTERDLDEFLIRKMKDVDLKSKFQSSVNPDVLQAIVNLTVNKSYLISISKDVLHWNIINKKGSTLVKDLWTHSNITSFSNNCDDISIKMKSEIEIILLNLCHSVLTDPNIQTEELFNCNSDLITLVKKCAISTECFQICSSILNYVFIHTKHNLDIETFISSFIQKVNENCSISISELYPVHLRSTVLLLDIDLDVLPHSLKNMYIKQTLINLKMLHEEDDGDLILLLSHFPGWFDIYND